eukprot:PhF_6_TR37527/c1_g1_i2/m.55513/K14802/DRS2, ATP8A; phospholipid-transporting ATPase
MEFVEKRDTTIVVNNGGRRETWEILNIFEFNSTRKRMSVIVRDPRKRLMLLCKGADTVVYDRLRRDPANKAVHDATLGLLTKFAAEGLRTLVLAVSYLDEITYKTWSKKYDAAATAITDKAEKMERVAEEIEKDLELVGTTAIEDKLQANVPQTTELL